ncbi:DUF2798 domain-containing protein [Hymenobacter terrenus]|uniref:DUF2798 domain-containing protein n=1 Tax=Hymenobacter terrenus TaxID=1629124 RepID=UPI000619A37C|nr:DUF2798 domain-containing protein [Hymenobacter terrenus]
MKQRVVFALLMGVVTTGLVSFILLGVNRGFHPGFGGVWLKSWAIGYVVVIPIILLVAPLVQRLTSMLVGEPARASQQA